MEFKIGNDVRWIWSDKTAQEVNQYTEFRRELAFDGSNKNLTAVISVDSDYELWINGNLVGSNQYPNWPAEKTYNSHDVSHDVKKGLNCIAVRVYYRGENFAVYCKGKAGLLFSLCDENNKVIAASDSSWKCRPSAVYKNGAVPKTTVQLRFTVEYDARKEDGWKMASFDDSQWEAAVDLSGPTDGFWKSLRPRPVKALKPNTPKPANLIASGYIIRKQELDSTAKTMMSDAMLPFPLDHSLGGVGQTTASQIRHFPNTDDECVLIKDVPQDNGIYLIYDLGRQEAGLLEIEIDTAEGTILDIAHGEHLDDLRVRAEIGGRNFADRYVCRSGRQKWLMPYHRLGCRYLEVHIPKINKEIKIYYVTLKPVLYPFEEKGNFECSDTLLNEIWAISKRTLQLCAHEHYEDCPWREQALYGCDSRMQALFSYYVFGNYEFPSASFDLLGGGIREDDLLEITAPAKVPVDIPGFSLHWVIELWELFLYSGKKELVGNQAGRICRILDRAISRMTAEGLVVNSTAPDHWHFYEWTEGLEGDLFGALDARPQEAYYDALYNLLLIGALRAASNLGKYLDNSKLFGYASIADKIANAFHSFFWDDKKKLYASFVRKGIKSNYAQLTQSLAIMEKVCPDEKIIKELCRKMIEDDSLVKAELSSLLFIYEALLQTDMKYLQFVLQDIRNKFGSMLKKGATSLWETVDGAEAFSRAGSLCHGWSSILNYIAGAYILGVKPLEPGFTKYTTSPAADLIPFAKGVIPTACGDINVSWDSAMKKESLRIIANLS
jgi:hypothetical protein